VPKIFSIHPPFTQEVTAANLIDLYLFFFQVQHPLVLVLLKLLSLSTATVTFWKTIMD